VTIRLLEHFPKLEDLEEESDEPVLRKTPHSEKMESLGSLGEGPSALTSTGGSEERQQGSVVKNVWRWTKSLRIREGRFFTDDYDITEERLETLVRAIRGLNFIEHVE